MTKTLYEKPSVMTNMPNMFCPGCGHSIVTRLVAEALEELELATKTILVMPIGCGGMASSLLDLDVCSTTHGRAPAVATGIKRIRPDKNVLVYQGDGDLAAIGMAETIHAANRGEKISIIFVNNCIFGMTGGQMAPTTLVGQKSTTTVDGRKAELAGYPINVCEILNQLRAPVYIARFAVNSVAEIRKAKKGIMTALELQNQGAGYSFVEILAPCPTGLGVSPLKSMDFVKEQMMPTFPLGVFRQPEGGDNK